MAPSSRDRISVDLRGLKATLVERARSRGLSPSDFVRGALVDALGPDASMTDGLPATRGGPPDDRVRLSLRLSRAEAAVAIRAAKVAGLPLGAFVAGLIAGVPVLAHGGARRDHLALLVASSAELSTLSRHLHQLTALLRHGSVRAAQEYRQTLDKADDEIRRHLALASEVLAELRPSPLRSALPGAHPRKHLGEEP